MATPTITNIAPATASIITTSQLIGFDVTSTPALIREMVFVRFPGAGIEEVVWDGTAFTERYAGTSGRTAIPNGFKYGILRNPAWPDSPQFAVYAVNSTPEELNASWGYTISEPPTYSLEGASLPGFSGSSVPTASGFEAHDQDYFLRLADRSLDADYVAGLKAGEGYEIIQQQAKIAARVSTAIVNTANGMLAAYATGGSFASGIVEFYRTAFTAGAVTVKAGTVVQSYGGRFFIVISDAVFGSTDLGPVAAHIRSVFQDWQTNVTGQITTPAGVTIDGEIDTIRTLVQDPLYGDPSVRVRQIQDTLGGRAPMLDLLARANGIRRARGETDPGLSYRIRNLPDNLTPASMARNLKILLSPYGVRWEYTEPFELDFMGAYDMPPSTDYQYSFFYDDPRPRYFPCVDWYADSREQWGAFYVAVGKIQPIQDLGGVYDDAALSADQLVSPISHGRRAISAYDLPDSATMGSGDDLTLCYDGRDYGIDALLGSVHDMMDSNRAAGVATALFQEGW
jgi:hypothetical protein